MDLCHVYNVNGKFPFILTFDFIYVYVNGFSGSVLSPQVI